MKTFVLALFLILPNGDIEQEPSIELLVESQEECESLAHMIMDDQDAGITIQNDGRYYCVMCEQSLMENYQ